MKIVSVLVVLGLLLSCEETADVQVGNKTTMDIERIYDAGEVMRGEIVTAKFKVTNTGDYPLILASVKPSCSCTVSSYPEEPIQSGETDYITATVNTNRVGIGIFSKHVNVTANTKPPVSQLKIKGVVISK
jgi:hypothetical protein